MTTQTKTTTTRTRVTTRTKLPAPLYAAAGAGDLAYQRLRKLAPKTGDLHLRDELDKVRERTRRSAKAFLGSAQAGAQAAQHRAAAVYTDLVQRGRRVVEGDQVGTGMSIPVAATPVPTVEPVSAVRTAPRVEPAPAVIEPVPAVVEPAPTEVVEAMAEVAEAAARPTRPAKKARPSTTS